MMEDYMSFLSSREVREIGLKRMDAALLPQGWKRYKDFSDHIYVMESEQFKARVSIRFDIPLHMELTLLGIHIYEVEDILSQVLGNKILDPLSTCNQRITKKIFRCTLRSRTDENHYGWIAGNAEHKEDVIRSIDMFLNYIFTVEKDFLAKFLYLPNIVRNMNEQQNGDDIKGVLEDSPLMNGLIISKLCNDPDYENKVKRVEDSLSEDSYKWPEDYIREKTYYEKLMEILPTITPRYSMDDPDEEKKLEEIRRNLKGFDRIEIKEEPEEIKPEEYEVSSLARDLLFDKLSFVDGETFSFEVSKKIVCKAIETMLKKNNFSPLKQEGRVIYYTRKTELGEAIVPFCIKDDGMISLYCPSIRIDACEKWMKSLEFPMKPGDFDCYGTIQLPLSQEVKELERQLSASRSMDDLKKLCVAYWAMLVKSLANFMERYSKMENVYDDLISLLEKGEGWDDFVWGVTAPERIFRGTVLLKLCAGEEAWEKWVLFEDVFREHEEYAAWLPAVDRFSKMLDEIRTEFEVE